MNPRRSGWRQAVAIVLITAALTWFWCWYAHQHWLHKAFGRFLGNALPIYAADLRVPLDRLEGTTGRLALALLIAAAALSLVMVAVARRWRTSICVALTFFAALAINVTVARIPAGNDSFVAPFERRGLEYFGDTRHVGNKPVLFVKSYPLINFLLSQHAGTHPPGGVLFLWLGEKVFGDSLDAACWLAVVFTALGVVPAYVLARTVGGAAAARRMLPLYVAAPNLILFGATCMDGVFLTFAVAAMAACFVALRQWSIIRPLVAGALLWLATFMSFAVVAIPLLMGCQILFVGIRRPREGVRLSARAVFVGIVFVLCQVAAEWILHYDVRATVNAAMDRDYRGLGVTGYENFEVWRDLSLGNALAFIFGSGVSTAALYIIAALTVLWAAARRRSSAIGARRRRAFVLATGLCVTILACSTLFTMEVERVWMFLTPVVLIAATIAFRGTLVWIVAPVLMLAQAFYIEWNYNTWW